ncbi:aldo/keto reductase [Kutzneria buriramensis]|uniref:Aryl-alcohol dehydrogenase-like predicted oxidoreductase n=1 Tax=Kutzneria buriramensis TaxID=1045776 RepID=A0A3E0HKV4_9PSEU|nr:aldo/keto reductase [Kutzneria buriramensis]REH47099.1 aryl-alcohol dehydrogenase-like predicted oxidoreductase [Kutzneria buriramensis]
MNDTTHIRIGRDLEVRRLGYGAMHLTGPGVWGEPADPDHAIAVLRRAVDLGVTFIDTADAYGPGTNEEIIRRALHPYPADLVISTKGGMLRSGPDDWNHETPLYIMPLGRPEYLRQQVDLSLRRLGVDRIDLYQLHSIDPTVPLADQIGELVRLQRQGKINEIGVSDQPGVSVDNLAEARRHGTIAAVECLYNIVDRAHDDVLAVAEREHIAFIPYFPLGHGDLVGPLATVAKEYGCTVSQLALAWLLHRSPATLLIPGTTSLSHLAENMAAADITLAESEMAAITAAVDDLALPTFRPTKSARQT